MSKDSPTTQTHVPPPLDTARTSFFHPRQNPSRNLVVCLDGSSNEFSSENSNVIKFFSLIEASDRQRGYYDSGVGTYVPSGASMWGQLRKKIAMGLDLAVAWNFEQHILNAYTWLMDNYQEGDKIYLFGFSRGSYCCRSLAGMIQRVGLLPKGMTSQVPLAYAVYKDPSRIAKANKMAASLTDDEITAQYREIFGRSKHIDVHFCGVFDTVASLGYINSPSLPFASAVGQVHYFRHALALDERRAKFQPEFHHPDEDETVMTDIEIQRAWGCGKGIDVLKEVGHERAAEIEGESRLRRVGSDARKMTEDEAELEVRLGLKRNKEVWFMGCHSDVGGGNTLNGTPALSNVSFRWMVREAHMCGLLIDPISLCRSPAYRSLDPIMELIPPSLRGTMRGKEVVFADGKAVVQERPNFGDPGADDGSSSSSSEEGHEFGPVPTRVGRAGGPVNGANGRDATKVIGDVGTSGSNRRSDGPTEPLKVPNKSKRPLSPPGVQVISRNQTEEQMAYLTPEKIMNIIVEACKFDVKPVEEVGGELNDDLRSPVIESLRPIFPLTPLTTLPWRMLYQSLEWAWLQRWVYDEKTGKRSSTYIQNKGRARQMTPTQVLHRSVQKRISYAHNHPEDKAVQYAPKAFLPYGTKHWEWEGVCCDGGGKGLEGVWEM